MATVLLSTKAVGDLVKLNVNGVAKEFLVVHQGKPSSIYDNSCDGTWLLMKDVYKMSQWQTEDVNDYEKSIVHKYLKNEFVKLLDPSVQNAVNTVKIPCTAGTGGSVVASGANGLETKVFALSIRELGYPASTNSFPDDGGWLDFFADAPTTSNNVRPAMLNGAWTAYWTRSAYIGNTVNVYGITDSGTQQLRWPTESRGIRPAMVMPGTLKVDESGNVVTNTAPTAPDAISVPTEIRNDNNATIAWGTSTDADGNLSGYVLEQSVNGGTWTQIYKGSGRSYAAPITYGWNTVQYRVKAYDTEGAESGYTTSEKRTVNNNKAPEISGSNKDLGTFSTTAPSFTYTVTDADGDTVAVAEALDGTVLRSYVATLGSNNKLTFDAESWRKVTNGKHTLTITAADPDGETAIRTVTFTKSVTTVTFEQTAAMAADAMPTQCMVNIKGSFPDGCALTVEICNNGNDASPTWESVSSQAMSGGKIFFSNTKKTAAAWGVKIRVRLERGSATGECYIQSVGGNFE